MFVLSTTRTLSIDTNILGSFIPLLKLFKYKQLNISFNHICFLIPVFCTIGFGLSLKTTFCLIKATTSYSDGVECIAVASGSSFGAGSTSMRSTAPLS